MKERSRGKEKREKKVTGRGRENRKGRRDKRRGCEEIMNMKKKKLMRKGKGKKEERKGRKRK